MTRALVLVGLACALAACDSESGPGGDGGSIDGGAGGGDGGDADGALAAGDSGVWSDGGTPGAELGAYQLTYYWVAYEEDFTGVADTSLYDRMCRVLAVVPKAFADSLRIEGTGRLADGRMLNVSGACMCPNTPCYLELDATRPWGLGVQNRPLVPFRSIAVDRNLIAIGTRLYVRELDGVMMPGDAPWGAFRHDGCVTADDVGGGITGMHIDFFAALRMYYRTLDSMLRLSTVHVHSAGTRCN